MYGQSTINIHGSMISHCSPFWRKSTGEYPPVSIQLNKYPFSTVEVTPFWRMHEIISEGTGFNRVAKKMRTYFEMGTDGHRFLCFQFGVS